MPFITINPWLQRIPPTLWKLGHAQPELSLRLLRSVQTLVRLEPEGAQGPLAAALVELQAQSLVLWGVPAPKPAGAETAQSKRFLKGPLAALPAEAQVRGHTFMTLIYNTIECQCIDLNRV